MHRALLLPEIVEIVVEIGEAEPGFLFNCLTVNKIFFNEVCRILWETCNSSDHGRPYDSEIRRLGNLVQHADSGPERAQIYADHIQNLDFRYEDDDFENTDARWHPVLSKLKFPKLRSLSLYPSDEAKPFNTGEALLKYAQPNLQFLHASCTTQLSNGFLERLITQSPGLLEVRVRSDDDTITTSDLECFLSKASSLEQLALETGKAKVWSSTTFTQMSKCPKLHSFDIPELVEEEWIAALGSSTMTEPFPDLRFVTAAMKPGAVERFSALRPNLEHLCIVNKGLGATQNMLAAASRFSQLKYLTFTPDSGSQITGHEIIQIAQGCPNLEELKIGEDEMPFSAVTGITDDVVRSLAEGLPKLRELQLAFHSDTQPSMRAIIHSLSRHCPDLNDVTISCQNDWTSILSVPEGMSFPELSNLCLFPSNNTVHTLTEEERIAVVQRFEKYAADWFPALDYLEIEGDHDGLGAALVEIADRRTYASCGDGFQSSEESDSESDSEETADQEA